MCLLQTAMIYEVFNWIKVSVDSNLPSSIEHVELAFWSAIDRPSTCAYCKHSNNECEVLN